MRRTFGATETVCLSVLIFALCPSVNGKTQMKSTKLALCPDKPNCVSSQAEDRNHRVMPLSYKDSGQVALKRLKTILLALDRSTLVLEKDGYVHVEFRSKMIGFVDDVEAQLNENTNTIDIRSASRTGYWDFGVNRKRVETIRARFKTSD